MVGDGGRVGEGGKGGNLWWEKDDYSICRI